MFPYAKLVHLASLIVIRPHRNKYNIKDIPTNAKIPNFGAVERTSIALRNKRGLLIYGSYYRAPKPRPTNPCIVYLHGNASNQIEGRYIVSLFVPLGISVFCFDFSGCGCSEGKYITLGYYEIDDVKQILQLLREDFGVQEIGLWGRSMGASISVDILALKEKGVKAAVCDSPFTSIRELFGDICSNYRLPAWALNYMYRIIREHVMDEAFFDIDDVNALRNANRVTSDILFIHGKEDNFIPKRHSHKLWGACSSQNKELRIVEGNHNSDRPEAIIIEATTFLCKAFNLEVVFESNPSSMNIFTAQNSQQHFGSVEDLIINL